MLVCIAWRLHICMAACLGIWSAATPQAAEATGGWRLVRGERGRDGLLLSACAGRTDWCLVCCTTAGSSGGRAGGSALGGRMATGGMVASGADVVDMWRLFYSHNGTGAGGCTVGCGGRVFGGRVCVRACGGLGRECTSGGECVLQLHASAETDKGVEGATLAVGMGGWAQARMGARRRWAHGAGGRTARLGARRGWAHGAVGRTLDGRTLDGRTLDGRTLDGRTLDGRTLDGRTLDGRTLDGRTLDGRTLDGRTLDGHTSDGRTLDGRTLDGRMADGRMADGPMADGPMADGPMADGHICTSAGTTTGCTGFDTRQQSLHVDEISWWDAWERDTGAAGRMADECLGGVAAGVGADGRGGGHVASAPARATAGSWAAWDHWAMWSGCRWDERENDDRVEFMHELVVVVCTSAAMHVLASGTVQGEWDGAGRVGRCRASGTVQGEWDGAGRVGRCRASGTVQGEWDEWCVAMRGIGIEREVRLKEVWRRSS
ncbi:unnamed protein product [Closterium sp. NIES-65]|nr:unnamed protein product [Closterium sp. NIES-65]